MTAIIKANPQLPAAIQKLVALATPEAMNELAGGVTSGFPIIGYKGKVWRIRKGGEEKLHVDDQNQAMPSIDVVIVQGNPAMSKIYYDKKFEDGTNEAPRCFSNDGVKPDASVNSPINPTCANCPNNVWGSRITENGKKSRACSDARRMAVVFADDLADKGDGCEKFLLRVPPASLNPLKDYAEKVLAPKGIPPFAIVTRIGFDVQAAHPQFMFKAQRFLNDDEAEAIVKLRGSEDIKRILAEAQDFATGAAGSDQASEAVGTSIPAAATSQPAAVTTAPVANKKAAMRPASDEEAGLAAVMGTAPAPAPAPAKPQPIEGEIMAAPPPKKKKAAPAPAPAPAPVVADVEEDDEPAPAPAAKGAAVPAGFDAMLDDILNG